MRMQNVREGQQWQSRLGITCTILEIFDELTPVMVHAEMGGVLVKLTLKEFNTQFHRIIRESYLVDADQPTPRVYNHGDVWMGEDGNNYMVIRGMRKRGNGIVLYSFGENSNLVDNRTTSDIKLVQMISYNKPVSSVGESVLYGGETYTIDSIEPNNVTICLPDGTLKTMGLRFLVAKNPRLSKTELLDITTAQGLTRDEMPYEDLDKIITEIENDVILDRWEEL